MRNLRATIIGIVVGLLLLGAVAGYAVGLPKVEDDATPTMPNLPDRLDSTYVAVSSVTADDFSYTAEQNAQIAKGLAAQATKQNDAAAKQLADLYGAAEVAFYADPKSLLASIQQGQQPTSVAVTVVPGAPGLVIPSGPFSFDQQLGHYQLTEVDGHQCAAVFTDGQTQTGAPQAGAETYQLAECRAAVGDLTYDVFGTGVPVDKVAGYLDDLVADADGSEG